MITIPIPIFIIMLLVFIKSITVGSDFNFIAYFKKDKKFKNSLRIDHEKNSIK